MPGNRDEERNYYWSLRDIPKFEGKGEQPFSHLMEFEDYLIASGVRVEPDEDENGRRIDVDYRDIINKFKASLKNNARVWYSMYIDGRITDLYSEAGWKTIKSKFLTYFNPIGSTKEQQIKAWKELKWKPEEEKLTDFVFRFSQLVPFMAIKEHRKQVNTKDTIRVVAESIQDSIYENNKTIMRQLDNIGDRIANVVEDFQREQSSRDSRNRYRDRSNSRDRDKSGDSYRNRSRDRGRSNSREGRNNRQRSGSGQRYFDKKDFSDYCIRTGHSTHECFKLENYLKKQGKRIVLHDNDDLQDIAQLYKILIQRSTV